jgi:short-subunit dehydrogenase
MATESTRWEDSVVVITGASRGVGRALAVASARRGARVGLIARSVDDLNETLKAIDGRGVVATADVGDRDQVRRALTDLRGALGPVDILVCNAGIGAYGPLATSPVDTAELLIRTNYLGAVNAVQPVIADMIDRRRGHVVFVGSIAGRLGVPLEAAYSASKFAVSGLADALTVELGARGIGVTLVSLGPVATDFFDTRGVPYRRRWPRPLPPERVARAIIRSVERDRSEIVRPRFLRVALVARAVVPGLYRRGLVRSSKSDLAVSESGQDAALCQGEHEDLGPH